MQVKFDTSGRISGELLWLFFAFMISVGTILYYLVGEHGKDMAKASAFLTARTTAENIDNFRAYYSEEILATALKGGLRATHEYRKTENSMPLPATVSIELGEFMRARNAHIQYKMFSLHPFPGRRDRVLDERELEILQAQSTTPVHVEDPDGRLRYFSPVIMGESCIGCHNTHVDSPRTDWQVGDVRGYQEVVIPSGFATHAGMHHNRSFDKIIAFIVFAFATGCWAIVFVVKRNKRAFADIREYADSEARKSDELSIVNMQLEKSVGQLNAVLDNAVDAIITIDSSGTISSANMATEKIFGYSLGELIGCNVSSLMEDNAAKEHDGYLDAYMESGESRIIGIGREVMARRKSGSIFPIELSVGEVNLDGIKSFTGIIRDVSERRQTEDDLRSSQEKESLLSLVASRTDNAVIIANPDGTIRWVNEGFERISGFTLKESEGQRPGNLLQGSASDSQAIARMSAAVDAQESFTAELINYNKSGNQYWIQIEAQPVFDSKGNLDAFIAIERDITEARRRTEDLEKAREAAETSNRSKSRFLAMMSHEVRTPLNAIVGSVSLIRDESDVDQRLAFVDVAQTAAANLQTIISDILDVSKMEAGVLELEYAKASMSNILAEVASVLEPRAQEKGIYLEWTSDSDVLQALLTDVGRVRQILINFVSNAIKFTEHGGVKIRAFIPESDGAEKFFRVEVSDTGAGISKEDQAQIFEEFWTKNLSLENTAPGTGLGLAISRRIAQTLRGDVGVESKPGIGSTFWLELPLQRAVKSDTEVQYRKSEDDLPTRFTGHLLLAEDNSANQLVITAMLKKLGLSCDIAANGIEAISAVQLRRYDMILMDVNMPEMDGIEATRILRRDGLVGTTPVVAATAHVMKGDREKLGAEGFDDYISKPLTGLELRRLFARFSAALNPDATVDQ